MSAIDTLRTALFGSPPDPNHEPSREGVLAAFTEMQQNISAIASGIPAYDTVADLPAVTSENDGQQARVFNDPDPANNTFWIVESGSWVIDTSQQEILIAAMQPSLDAAQAAAAQAEATAASIIPGAAVSSWSRPIVPAERVVRVFDYNARRWLDSGANNAWYDASQLPARSYETPSFPLDEISIVPVLAFSMVRPLSADYSGPLFRARRLSDNSVQDFNSVGAALTDGFNKVTGWFDQITGEFMSFSAELDLAVRNGLPGAYNATGSSSATPLFTLAQREAFNTGDGCSAVVVHGFPDVYTAPSENQYLFRVTTGTSATQPRHALRISPGATPGGKFQSIGRKADAGTAVVLDLGSLFGGVVSLYHRQDNANSQLVGGYDGTVTREHDPFDAGGVAATTVPQTSQFTLYPGCHLFEAIAWAAPLDATDEAFLLADQRRAYGRYSAIFDGAQSWWTDTCASNGNGITTIGITTSTGQQGVVEFDEATHEIVDFVMLETVPFFTQDDHNSILVHYLDDGSLVVSIVGHNNAVSGTDEDERRMLAWYSPTGRIADLGAPVSVDTGDLQRLNYQQAFESPERLLISYNADNDASWGYFFSVGKGIGDFQRGRKLVRDTVVPAYQVYKRGVQLADGTVRDFFYSHPSMESNPIRLMEFNINSGDVTIDGSTVDGNVYDTSQPTNSTLYQIKDMPAIYTPPAGRSVRLMDVSPDGNAVSYVIFDTATFANASHAVLVYDGVGDRFSPASWTARSLGPAGESFFDSYFGAAPFARHNERGMVLFRTFEFNGTWYLAKESSPNRGISWTEEILHSSATYKLPRCFVPANASSRLALFAMEGPYTIWGLDGWRQRMLPFADPAVV